MKELAVLAVLLSSIAPPATGPVVIERRTGMSFPVRVGDLSLLGVGVRTKTFLRIKVYALGFYVADSALSGPLAAHRGQFDTSAFYRELVVGDFEKVLVLKLARDLSAEQIQGTFRSHLASADGPLREQFVSYFGATSAGQELVLRRIAGGRLETTVGGVAKPAIENKAFAEQVFAIWLCDRPAEDPIRKQLVSRAGELIR